MTVDVLIFAEDPGAANFMAGLPAALARRDRSSVVLVQGAAGAYLKVRGETCVEVEDGTDGAAVLMQHPAHLVVTGTSENRDSLGLQLIDRARVEGVPSVSIVDAATSLSHRFRGRSGDPLAHLPDHLLVPDEPCRAELTAIGVPAARITVVGNPQHRLAYETAQALRREDRAQRRRELFGPACEGRKVLVFLSELSDGLDPAQYRRGPDYTLSGRGGSVGRTEIVLEEVLDALKALPKRPYFVVRLHPKEPADRFVRYSDEIEQISRRESPLEIVFFADAVVGLTTSLLVESSVMAVPSLSILPREAEKAWLPQETTEVVACVTSASDIGGALEKILNRIRPSLCEYFPLTENCDIAAFLDGRVRPVRT